MMLDRWSQLLAESEGRSSPLIERVPERESAEFRRAFTQKVMGGAQAEIKPAMESRILMRLEDAGRKLPGADARSDDVNIETSLQRAGYSVSSQVFFFEALNNGLEPLFRSEVGLWSNYLREIWRPSGEDIVLVDEDLRWYLYIAHYGALLANHLPLDDGFVGRDAASLQQVFQRVKSQQKV